MIAAGCCRIRLEWLEQLEQLEDLGWDDPKISQEGSSVHDVRTRFGKMNHLEEIWSLGGFDMGCF